MKVLLLMDRLLVGGKGTGKEHIHHNLIRAHVENGYDTAVVLLKKTNADEAYKECKKIGATYIRPGFGFSPRILIFCIANRILDKDILRSYCHYSKIISGVEKHIKGNGKPDVITVSSLKLNANGILVKLLSTHFQVPFVYWEHRSHYQRGKITHRKLKNITDVLTAANLVLTVSPQLARSIKQVTKKEYPFIQTMPNPVKEEFFSNTSQRCDFVKEFSQNRFVFAGWENWQRAVKRLDIALEAFSIAQKKYSQICLILAGSYPDWAEDMVDKLDLKNSVLFTGKMTHSDIVKFVYSIDCCVITSDHETFGLPAAEALAAGKPVVTTECGGPESIVSDISLGRTVKKGDANEFARAMLEVVENKDTFNPEKISLSCRKKYSEEAFRKKWLDVYQRYL